MYPKRCAAVTGVDRTERLLADLRRRLGFLVVDYGGTLRLHDLLHDHLRDELEQAATDEQRAELHRRAATGARGAERVEQPRVVLAAADRRVAVGVGVGRVRVVAAGRQQVEAGKGTTFRTTYRSAPSRNRGTQS